MDELKVNDTGELELGSDSKASGDLDKLLEIDEIKLEEIPLKEAPPKSKREARVVNAAAPKKKGAEKSADDELSLDLDDLELDLEMEDAKPQRLFAKTEIPSYGHRTIKLESVINCAPLRSSISEDL